MVFLKEKKIDIILLGLILVIASFFIFNNFLTMPRIGLDEGSNLISVRNFA